MIQIRASREFTAQGLRWYPQIFVQALGLWVDLSSVRHKNPEGFVSPDEAIHRAQLDIN